MIRDRVIIDDRPIRSIWNLCERIEDDRLSSGRDRVQVDGTSCDLEFRSMPIDSPHSVVKDYG